MELISRGGLVLLGLTMTFASIDWAMSLEPHWFSTIYGVIFMGGSALTAFAFDHPDRRPALPAPAAAGSAHRRPAARPRQADARLRDALGLLQLLAVPHHLVRQPPGGDPLVPVPAPGRLAVGRAGHRHRALRPALRPAAVAPPEAQPQALAGVALFVLALRYIDLFWLVAPRLAPRPASDSACWTSPRCSRLGGLWLWLFVRQLEGHPLLPLRRSRRIRWCDECHPIRCRRVGHEQRDIRPGAIVGWRWACSP